MNALRTALVVGVLGLAGCAGPAPATTASPPAAPASSAAGFGGTDRAWIEINVAMDEELLPLLDLVPTHSKDSAVRSAASQIKTFTDAELTTLRELQQQAGISSSSAHKGMSMPGMVSPEQVARATKLTGPAFDAEARKAIVAHLQQGQSLASSEGKSGVEPRTLALALQALRDREQAMTALKSAH